MDDAPSRPPAAQDVFCGNSRVQGTRCTFDQSRIPPRRSKGDDRRCRTLHANDPVYNAHNRPTTNEMNSPFISSLPLVATMFIFIGDSLLSIPSVETEHPLCFRLSGSHPAVRVYSFLKRDDLNRQRFSKLLFQNRRGAREQFPS